MRVCLAVLLLGPSALLGQQSANLSGRVKLEIRSTDTVRVLDVRIDVHGELFSSLGILRPAGGTVNCAPSGCVATTPAILILTPKVGDGRLNVPEGSPELEVTVSSVDAPKRYLVARGHTVSFQRNESGQLSIRAPQIITRF